jgi:hypothetical protein
MRRLGYDRYGAQGGDWGSGISRTVSQPGVAVGPEKPKPGIVGTTRWNASAPHRRAPPGRSADR